MLQECPPLVNRFPTLRIGRERLTGGTSSQDPHVGITEPGPDVSGFQISDVPARECGARIGLQGILATGVEIDAGFDSESCSLQAICQAPRPAE